MTGPQAATVEMRAVDTNDAQMSEEEEWSLFFELDISGQDKSIYVRSWDRTSDYSLSPDSLPQGGVAAGELLKFRWTSHLVYPGVERDVWLYLPHGVEEHDTVNLIVFQDGSSYFGGQVNATHVLDNLIQRGEIPMTAALFVNPGETGPGYPFYGGDDNRSIEYDSVNGDYARFVVEELLPVVRMRVNLTDDPAGRAICGMSSGGACALTAAFHRPQDFGVVISHCGSFIAIRGANQLPAMIRQTPRKPIRVWHQTGSRDVDAIFGSIPLANHDLASALAYRRYDSKFEFGNGGHSLRHAGAVFPETLRWVFRDQPVDRAPITR